jgi:hypothetical protein
MVLSIVWEFLRNSSTSVLTPPLRTVQYFRTIPVQYVQWQVKAIVW